MSRNSNLNDRQIVSRLSVALKQGNENSVITGIQATRLLNIKRAAANRKESEMLDEKQIEFQEIELDPNQVIDELCKSKCYVKTQTSEDDSITIFLHHSGFYPKENKCLRNQKYMNKLVNSIRAVKYEFKYPKLGITNENQFVKAMERSITIIDSLLTKYQKKIMNYVNFQYGK